MSENFVVIGGGQAATQAIHTARQKGFDGRIALIAEEPRLPYQRPPLSKQYLAGKLPRERLSLRPEAFYTSRDVDLLLGRRAMSIDRAAGSVQLDDGSTLGYSSLLLATGSRVRRLAIPGADLDGVCYLRTIDDVDAISPELGPGKRLVIIGAGYIGLEVAAVARSLDVEVTVIEAADRVLARVTCPEMSQFYSDLHRQAGVDLRCSSSVTAFHGESRVREVELGTGERLDADLVIIGIGVLPNVEIAEAAGLECNNGIRVDACARTADPAIHAAGDCTNHRHPFVERFLRLESVHNAIEQSKSAADGLVGEERAFDEIPWFWSDQYDLKLQIAGVSIDFDRTVVRGEIGSGQFAIYYLRSGRPIAIDAVNWPREFMQGKSLLAARVTVPVEVLADPDADLSAYWESS